MKKKTPLKWGFTYKVAKLIGRETDLISIKIC